MASINGSGEKKMTGGEVVQNCAANVMVRLDDLVDRMGNRLGPVLIEDAPALKADPKEAPMLPPWLQEMYAKLNRMDEALSLANRILDRVDF